VCVREQGRNTLISNEPFKWRTGVLGANGNVYGIPWNSGKVLAISPKVTSGSTPEGDDGHSVELSFIGHVSQDKEKWELAITAFNGRIFAIPCRANSVLVIDTKDDSIHMIGEAVLSAMPDTQKYLSAVLAPDGRIYAMPCDANEVLVVDTATEHVSTIKLPRKGMFGWTSARPASSKGFQWGAAACVADVVVGVPYNSSEVLFVHTVSGVVSSVPDGLGSAISEKYRCAVVVNGLVFAIPWNAPCVLVIDPVSKSTEAIGQGTIPHGNAKWSDAVVAGDGMIYAVPFSTTSVLTIDPHAKSVSLLGGLDAYRESGAEDQAALQGKWSSAGVLSDGRVCGIPYNANGVLIVDPYEQSVVIASSGALSRGSNRWRGAVACPSLNMIVGVPVSMSSALTIQPLGMGAAQSQAPVSASLVADVEATDADPSLLLSCTVVSAEPVPSAPPLDDKFVDAAAGTPARVYGAPQSASAHLSRDDPKYVDHLERRVHELEAQLQGAQAEIERLRGNLSCGTGASKE